MTGRNVPAGPAVESIIKRRLALTTAVASRDIMTPLAPDDFGPAEARHLLWRAGFGGTEAEVIGLARLGLDKAVDLLVDYDTLPALPDVRDLFNKDIMRPLSPAERQVQRAARQRQDEDTLARFRQMRQQAQQVDRRQMREIRAWWIDRMVRTTRPLEEKLTLFWHGHFATSYRTVEDSYHLFQQNRLFRGNAKSFARLLRGIIRDPAMLKYLNNNLNRRSDPNENLARELLELFSLGEGNYTERDIKEGARALTGYTYDDDTFVFEREEHDRGNKFILGARGGLDGDGFVDAILRHAACAPFIATRLYRFFVADVPAQPRDLTGVHLEAARALSQRIQRDGYELGPALKMLFRSRHFYDRAVVGNKIKSPTELLVGAMRTLGLPPRDPARVANALAAMGQNLFYPPSVKGWDGGRAWINTATLFARQNALAYLITGRPPTAIARPVGDYDPAAALPGLMPPDAPRDARSIAERLLAIALGRPNPHAAEAVAAAAGASDPTTRAALTDMVTLVTALPEYQLC